LKVRWDDVERLKVEGHLSCYVRMVYRNCVRDPARRFLRIVVHILISSARVTSIVGSIAIFIFDFLMSLLERDIGASDIDREFTRPAPAKSTTLGMS
jgi:hypothetical protein